MCVARDHSASPPRRDARAQCSCSRGSNVDPRPRRWTSGSDSLGDVDPPLGLKQYSDEYTRRGGGSDSACHHRVIKLST